MKKLIFITQAKGGIGKSVLVWAIANKFPEAIYLDMDDATTTTMKQLKYLEPKQVSFLNATKNIDRGLFNDFIEYISTHEKDLFICDLGASISEQLPNYFNDYGADNIKEGLKTLDIDLSIICVVGGQNMFVASMNYLEQLVSSSDSQFKIRIAINDHFSLSDMQQEEYNTFCKTLKLKDSFHWNLSRDKSLSVQQKINDVLRKGEGLQNTSVFTKILFQKSIQELPEL